MDLSNLSLNLFSSAKLLELDFLLQLSSDKYADVVFN